MKTIVPGKVKPRWWEFMDLQCKECEGVFRLVEGTTIHKDNNPISELFGIYFGSPKFWIKCPTPNCSGILRFTQKDIENAHNKVP